MGLVVKKKEKASYPPMDAGTYAAVCVAVIDIGEQYNSHFKNYQSKVMLIFEIPTETIEVDGEVKPRWISADYAQSLNEKSNLYKTLTSWLGRALSEEELEGFDLFDMLGQGCFINLLVEEKESGVYNQISAVMGLPKGMPEPQSETEKIGFSFSDGFDENVFEKIPEWIREKIKKSTEYQKLYAKTEELDFPDEDKETVSEEISQEVPF